MLSFFYGNLFILVLCSQSEAFLFGTHKPTCDVSVSECLECEKPGFYPKMFCTENNFGEFCYTKVVHNDSGIFTIKGRASNSFCEANKYKTSLLNPSCRSGNLPRGSECIDCCKQYSCDPTDLYCNKNIIQPEHMPFTVTTIRTTPPTTASSTTTTPQPTTPSTTPLPKSTQAPDEGLCQVCVERDGQNCDASSSNHYCSQQKKYCMNTIISDPKGGMIVLKKCADEVECKWNYWVDTLGDPKCNNVTGPQADNTCNYCCDNSNGNLPCNRDTIPKQLSTFDNSQEKKQCMTGNSNSQFQLETCSSFTSYCLNTVRYDTTAKHPEVYVEKKCAYEAECKGEWWEKSRKRPECLTQNFTGIADNNVICNYCCVSDGSGPCNGASVPEQIAHFEPVTTASTPTTATTLPTTATTLPTTAHGNGHHNTHVHTDHGHHHTVSTTKTTTESTTTTATLPSTTQSIDTSTSPSTTAQTTTSTTLPSTTTATTTTTMPTTTTTPAPIVCSGNTSIVCEDDPLAHCATLSSLGLCQKLQYNPDGEDIKFCPKTCNLCDNYCDYLLKPKQPPTTTPAPTHQMTTNTTIKPPTTTDKASTTIPIANFTTNTTAGKPSTNPTTKATISSSGIHKSTGTTTSNDQTTTSKMATTSTNPTSTATTATTTATTATTTATTATATSTIHTTTTATTATTTATTTSTVHSTTTAAHPECYICTGPVTLCENLYAPQGCTSDKPFCINDVKNNADGTRTVARRCASKTECIQSWWLGSSSRSECAGFDPTYPTLDQFSCSFCCTSPLCNKNIVPRDLYVQ